MEYTIIDQKTETHTFKFFIGKLNMAATMLLLNMGEGKTALSSHTVLTGIKNESFTGGPNEVTGNMNMEVGQKHKARVIISEFSKTDNFVSMNVKVNVNIKFQGEQTIFNNKLKGHFQSNSGLHYALHDIDDK